MELVQPQGGDATSGATRIAGASVARRRRSDARAPLGVDGGSATRTTVDGARTADVEWRAVSTPAPITVIEAPEASRDETLPRARSELANRVVNVVLAVVALLVLSPLLLVVALVVRLTSPGPVLYTQTRVGLDRRWNRARAMFDRRTEDLGGQVFTIFKFRSMYVDAERDRGAVWATKNDERVTPVGRVLRDLRIDEIPQLFNVIRGEMNIVGPRPERPSIVKQLRVNIAEYPQRHRAKPGITGWAQVNHSYDSCIDDVRTKVRYDLEYLRTQSLWVDLKIMVLTVPVMIKRQKGW